MVEQKISIDTNPGVNALKHLKNAIDIYNTSLGKLGKKQAELEAENERLKKSFQQNADRITEVEGALEALNEICNMAATSQAHLRQQSIQSTNALIVLKNVNYQLENAVHGANTALMIQATATGRDGSEARTTTNAYEAWVEVMKEASTAMERKNSNLKQQATLFSGEVRILKPLQVGYNQLAGYIQAFGVSSLRSASSLQLFAAGLRSIYTEMIRGYAIYSKQNQLFLEDATAMKRNAIIAAEIPTFYQRIIQEADKKNRKLREQKTATDQDTNSLLRLTYVANAAPSSFNRVQKSVQQFHLNLGMLNKMLTRSGHILFNFLGYGSLFRIFNEGIESIQRAYDLAKAISEIRTISDRAAMSTGEWSNELIRLSNAMGVDVLEAAEANYQALSNQVVEAGDAISFLRTEMVTAYTTVAELTDVVEATTGIMNAWHESSTAATRINAILFTTVEEGRVRMDEMANTLGRVSILSSRLNISLVEQQASLSQLTKLGLKYDEAVTAMRNVQLKLIKPSQTMTAILDKWGFSSGAAAVKALGLTGVMRKLYLETLKSRDASQEMADIFQELRGIIGALGLTQNDLRKEVELYTKSLDKNFEAFLERIESIDVRANKQLAKFRNLMLETFGQKILKGLVETAEAWGDIDTVLIKLGRGLRITIEAVIAYKAAWAGVQVVMMWHKYNLPFLVRQLGLVRGALAAVQVANKGLAFSGALATGGLTILGTLILERFLSAGDLAQDLALKADKLRQKFEDGNLVNLEQMKKEIAKDALLMGNAIDVLSQKFASFVANTRQIGNTMADQETFDKMIEGFEEVSKAIEKALEGPLDDLEKKINAIDDSVQELTKKARDEQIILNIDTELNRLGGDIKGLEEYYQDLVNQALEQTDVELLDMLREQSERVQQELRQRLSALNQEANQAAKERRQAAEQQRKEELADAQAFWNDQLNNAGIGGTPNKNQIKRNMRKQLEAQFPKVAAAQADEAALLAQLDELDKVRLKNQEKFIERQREIADMRRKESEELKKQFEERKAAFQELQDILAKVQTLKGEEVTPENVTQLGAFRNRILEIGGTSGLSTDKQFELIQQIAQFEIDAQKLINQKAQDDRLTKGQQTIDKLTTYAIEANKRVEEARIKITEFEGGGIQNKILKEVELFNNVTRELKANLKGQYEFADVGDASLFKPFQIIRGIFSQIGKGEASLEQLQALQTQLKKIEEIKRELSKIDTPFEEIAQDLGLLSVKEVDGKAQISILGEDFDALEKKFRSAIDEIEEIKKLKEQSALDLDIYRTTMQELESYLQTLPEDMQTFVNQADELLDKPIESTQEWIEKLEQVKKLLSEAKQLQTGQLVVGPNNQLKPGNVEYNTYSTRIDKIEIRPQRVSDAEINDLINGIERRTRQRATVSRGN